MDYVTITKALGAGVILWCMVAVIAVIIMA
jgi:hypothetical protein